ncbi:hypothetical protein B0H19DRAFT_1252642 [Mycena capillaripes]|nr:hypothetical protein B0H19DRAFT_1252642 [Mycena capillaripes]
MSCLWVVYGLPMGHPWSTAFLWPPPKSKAIYSTCQSRRSPPSAFPDVPIEHKTLAFKSISGNAKKSDHEAYLAQQAVSAPQPASSAPQPASSAPRLAAPAPQQLMAGSTPETVPRPARVTQSYTSA